MASITQRLIDYIISYGVNQLQSELDKVKEIRVRIANTDVIFQKIFGYYRVVFKDKVYSAINLQILVEKLQNEL